jgi:hypothetical protein
MGIGQWVKNTALKLVFDALSPNEICSVEALEEIIRTRVGIELNRRAIRVPREYLQYFGNLRSKQYPNELAQLLAFLYEKRHAINSYLEIGAGKCGTFFTIDSYLRSVNPAFQKSIALDRKPEPPHFDAYRQFYKCEYVRSDSKQYRPPAFVDFILIDGDHSLESVTVDYDTVHRRCRYAAFHDIALKHIVGADVHKFWSCAKAQHRCREFLNKDMALPDPVGIGLMELSDENSSSHGGYAI